MKTRNDPTAMKLAAEAGCDPRTAQRFIDGGNVRELVGDRLKAAAKKLGVKTPKRQ